MQLAHDVYSYYLTHVSLLTPDKRFHLATRMAAWQGEPAAFRLLEASRQFIVPEGSPVKSIVSDVFYTPQTGRRNAHELRQPFFDKYPKLYGAHLALFRVRHLKEVYGIDARDALFSVMPKEELLELEDQLLNDQAALKVLSTFAINYCYLLERVVLERETTLPLDQFLALGDTYDTTDKEQLQLLIYFYTHCIIGESNFYVRTITEDKLTVYRAMLSRLEPLIEQHFDAINLDNKLEFLVCARICGYPAAIADRIYEECQRSISTEGTFLIDIHNENVQSDRNDFIKSEHRNVLFIMSSTPYQPHSTLLSKAVE